MIARVLLVVVAVAGMLWGLAGSAAASCHRGVTYTAAGGAARGCEEVAATASGIVVGFVALGVVAFAASRVLLGRVGPVSGRGARAGPGRRRRGAATPGGGRPSDSISDGSSKPPAPRYRPGDNTRQSRSYGKSTRDIIGKANQYAARMRARGYRADVPPVRYDKYGRPDVTVTVHKYDPGLGRWVVAHIRHFLSKTRG